jgi:hypothetical protein
VACREGERISGTQHPLLVSQEVPGEFQTLARVAGLTRPKRDPAPSPERLAMVGSKDTRDVREKLLIQAQRTSGVT